MSLLTLCQGAAASLALAQPNTIIGNSNSSAVLLLNCAQREGRELSRRHNWQNLVVQKTWTSTATVVQSTAMGSDFDRVTVDTEVWDRTNNSLYVGPTPASIWQRLQTGITGGVAGWWRIIGNALNLYPAPSASHTFAWEYISKNWCESSTGTDQAAWAVDTDVGLIPEYLMELGVAWRYAHAKGWSYAEHMETYEREVEKAAARDRGLSVLAVSTQSDDDLPTPFWSGRVIP